MFKGYRSSLLRAVTITLVFSISYGHADPSLVSGTERQPASTLSQFMTSLLEEKQVHNTMADSQAWLKAAYQNPYGENYADQNKRENESKDLSRGIGKMILKTLKRQVEKAATFAFKEQLGKEDPFAPASPFPSQEDVVMNLLTEQGSFFSGVTSFFHYFRLNFDPGDKDLNVKISPFKFSPANGFNPFTSSVSYSFETKAFATSIDRKLSSTLSLQLHNSTSFAENQEKIVGLGISYSF